VPKEKAPYGGGPIRGGNIPPAVIERLEREIQGVDFGGVSLIVSVRDGHPTYRIEKTISVMTGD
jgi:hypothetical protein